MSPDDISLFVEELKLCAVKEGQTVAVLTENSYNQHYADAFMTAAQMLGARAFQVNVTAAGKNSNREFTIGLNALAGNKAAIQSLKNADIVIDLMFLLFSDEQKEITDAGARMLLVGEPLETLRTMFPTRRLRERVEAAERRLQKAAKLKVTSAAGTNVEYALGRYPVMSEYGYTDEPGRWDHWPAGMVLTHASDDGVEGVVVISAGDMLLPLGHYVRDPIHLEISGGYVRKISGNGMDAALMKDFMASFKDPRAFAVSHIGWGLNENATWFHTAVRAGKPDAGMNGRAYCGNVLFSTGPNVELGGTNDTQCHLDIPLRGCDLFLDGEAIIEGGAVVSAEMQAG